MKQKKGLGHWTKKAAIAGIALGISMTMSVLFAAQNDKKNGDKASTPFARIAKIPVVKLADGSIDHAATYAQAKNVALDIARYVAHINDQSASGYPADWIIGGLESGEGAADDVIDAAILRIPSPELIDPNNPAAGIKKANVMDLCNPYYAKMALGVAPITSDGKKVVNGYSHTPALPCELSTWNDDEYIYVDMLDPNAIFTLFFTDVLISEEMNDADFANAITAMPASVKSEIKAIVYKALDEKGYHYKTVDQKIGPKYKSLEQIFNVVANSPHGSPFKHVAYTRLNDSEGNEVAFGPNETKIIAQKIMEKMSIHGTPEAGTHEAELESILSPGSSWRSARHEPLGLPGKPEKNWVIEACSPKYAKMAMSTGMHHVTALPCEITVQRVDRDGNGTTESLVISYLDPGFMLGALFADISDEEKEAMADIPGLIATDLENIVEYALQGYELSTGVQFYFDMY